MRLVTRSSAALLFCACISHCPAMGAVNELQPGTCGSFASLANLFLPADGKVMGTEHGCPAGILKSHQANGSVFVFAENKTQPTQPHLAALGIHFRAVYQLKYVEHFTPPGPRIQGQTVMQGTLSSLQLVANTNPKSEGGNLWCCRHGPHLCADICNQVFLRLSLHNP